jgi:hypothetical protein
LQSVNFKSVKEQIDDTENEEDAAHDFLVFEKDEVRLFLNCL